MIRALSSLRPLVAGAIASVLALSLLALAGCSGGGDAKASSSSSTAASSAPTSEDLMTGIHHAVIEVEGYDPINVELNADED